MPHLRRRLPRGLSLLFLGLAAWLGSINGLGWLDHAIYDTASEWVAPAPRDDIVIVGFDDASLATQGRWPWPREQQAELLRRIGADDPKAIGLDLLLAEASTPEDDAALADVLADTPVVLPVFTQGAANGGLQAALPIDELADAAEQLAHVSVELDDDGVARSLFLLEGTPRQQWPHFALALASAGGARLPQPWPGQRRPTTATPPPPGTWQRDFWVNLAFTGPAGTYRHLSAADVLAGKVPPDTFTDRYVLVGMTASGLGDIYPTPLTGERRYRAGVEVSATALDNLLSGRLVTRVPAWVTALATVLVTLLGMLLLSRNRPAVGRWLLLALTLAVFGASTLLLRQGHWLPPGAALLMLTAFTLTYYASRLQSVARYLVEELRRARHHDPALPTPAPAADYLDGQLDALSTASARLRNLHGFLHAAIESLPDATWLLDADGLVVLANQQANRDFPPEPPEALAFTARLPTLQAVGESPPVLPFTPTAHCAGNEYRLADGRHALLRCAPCEQTPDLDGHWVVSLIDITPLRELEQRREETLRFLSHDMRAPQAAVLTLLDLHDHDPASVPIDELLGRIRRHVGRTHALAEAFVQLARAQSMRREFTELDLLDVVMDATDECWSAAQARDIALETTLPEHGVWVHGDQSQLVRGLINLIGNAIKYSPEHTTVHCALAVTDTQAIITVSDQGPGIAPEARARLFEPFSRVGGQCAGDPGGIGLGLAFTRVIVQQHGGTLALRDVPTAGATFELCLPRSAAPADDEEKQV